LFTFHELTNHSMYPNDPTGQRALSIEPNLSALGGPDCYTPNHRDWSYCGIQIFWFLSSVTVHTAVFGKVCLQLGWYHITRQHYTCSEAFTVLGVHCLSQCATGLHDQTAWKVSKAREITTYWLEFSDTPVSLHCWKAFKTSSSYMTLFLKFIENSWWCTVCVLPITSLLLHPHVSRDKIWYWGVRIFCTWLQKLTVEVPGSVHVQTEKL